MCVKRAIWETVTISCSESKIQPKTSKNTATSGKNSRTENYSYLPNNYWQNGGGGGHFIRKLENDL